MKYRKIIVILLTVLQLFMTAAPSYAESGELKSYKTVRMGFFEFGGMFEGASPDAEKSGYCYEYMMQVATYTGWKYEFVYGSYSELYEKLKKGEIDILPYTNYNEQRGQEVLFSDKALAEEEYYIAVRTGTYTTPESLNGKVITTLSGADYNGLLNDYISENGLDLNIRYYNNLDETWDKVISGEADATVFTSNAYSGDDSWSCICSFGKKPTYVAVSSERNDLLSELNEATGTIDIDNPALLGELYGIYFSDNPMRRSLSPEELKWLETHPVLHVGGFVNDAPYLYSVNNETGKATGLTVDVVEGIIERLNLGITADYKGYKTLREMEDALNTGEIDVIIPFYPSYAVASEHNLVFSNTVRVSNMEIVYRKGTSYKEAFRKVATPATKLGIYYVRDNFPESEIVGALSIQDAVDKVLSGEATGAIAQNIVLHNIKEKYDNLNSVVLSEGCKTCFATCSENYLLIRILNRGLNYYSTAEIEALSSQYNLEPNMTLKAFLASHIEIVLLIGLIIIILVVLIAALIQVNVLKKKADDASNSKTNFLFNMSHDIRTPMNAITGFTRMAKKNINDEQKVNDYLDKIDISGQQLLTLVNQILEMARIESGKIELEEKPVDIGEEYKFAVTVLGEQAKVNGLEFVSSFEDVVHTHVLADKARMSSVTLNITGNAIKYTPKGGRIDFIFKEVAPRKEGYATFDLVVRDNGIGMSKEFLKVMFDPFTREQNSTVSKIQGAGLGMSIVKSIVDLMDGQIDVQSELGKGTCFDVLLDFRIDEEAQSRADKEQAISAINLSGRRALLVEDNELNREIAMDILSDEGIITEEATDGTYAVEMLKDKGPSYYDFILMDIQMPLMNGYEATKVIREMYPEDKIIIIALSANAFTEDRESSVRAGMNDHVAKPIDINNLKVTLAKYLSGTQA